jgi:hypothetical protein
MYPAVKLAFNREVPDQRTEEEFWRAYLMSEYYHRDKGKGVGNDANAYEFGRTDDRFARYEEEYSRTAAKTGAGAVAGAPSLQQQKVKNMSGLVDPDVDLTAIVGDFGPRDPERGASAPGQQSKVVDKYNRFSMINMERSGGRADEAAAANRGENKQEAKSSIVDAALVEFRHSRDLKELSKPPSPDYIPLQLKAGHGQLGADEDNHDTGGGGFGKSSTIIRRANRQPVRIMTPAELSAQIENCFPTEEQALKCFAADKESLNALSAVAQRAAQLAGEGGAVREAGMVPSEKSAVTSGGNTSARSSSGFAASADLSAPVTEGIILPPQFYQVKCAEKRSIMRCIIQCEHM